MKLFSKEKLNTKIISMMMAVFLTVMVCSTDCGYAKEIKVDPWKSASYGNTYMDETFYLWHQVKSDRVPMYTYLSDGMTNLDEPNKELYENQKKQFRVMILHHYDCNFTNPTLGGEKGKLTKIDGGFMQPAYVTYMYNTWLQYNADYSRVENGSSSVFAGPGSLVSYRANSQLKPGEDCFITRGAQHTFFCDYSGEWIDDGMYRDNTALNTGYRNKHRYHFYYPDESDQKPVLTLTYTKGSTTNFYLFDEEGNAWGEKFNRNRSEWRTASVPEKGEGDLCIDTWAIKGDSPDKMTIPSYDGSGQDFALGIGRQTGRFVLAKWNDVSESYWMIYVGEPCPQELISDMIPSGNHSDKLSDGSYRTIEKPQFLKKDDEFVIEGDAILVVSSLLVLRGKIVNHGIIIVENGGAILSWDNGFGTIENVGGDVIVKKGGVVFVNNFKAEKQSVQLYQPLHAVNAEISDGVIDSRVSGAKIKGTDDFNNFSFIKVTKESNQYNKRFLDVDTSKLEFSGAGTKLAIGKDVTQYSID